MKKDSRLALKVALVLFFPVFFRPWWLLVASLGVFLLLVWILMPKKAR